MAKTFTAQVDAWVLKTKKRMDVITRQSANDVVVLASRTLPGVTRGGSVRRGFVPRDIGTLAASLVSTLHGGTFLSSVGENGYQLVVASMSAGDVASFGWTAPYARAMHYGYVTATGKKVGGWMWVDGAAQQWQSIVRKNIALAKQITGGG